MRADSSARRTLVFKDEPKRKNPETRDSTLISCLEGEASQSCLQWLEPSLVVALAFGKDQQRSISFEEIEYLRERLRIARSVDRQSVLLPDLVTHSAKWDDMQYPEENGNERIVGERCL